MIYDVVGLFMGLQFLGSMVDGCWLVFYDLIFMCFWWFLVACLKINANKSINTKPECRLRTCLNINSSCVNKAAFNQVESIFYSHGISKVGRWKLQGWPSILFTRGRVLYKRKWKGNAQHGGSKIELTAYLCVRISQAGVEFSFFYYFKQINAENSVCFNIASRAECLSCCELNTFHAYE